MTVVEKSEIWLAEWCMKGVECVNIKVILSEGRTVLIVNEHITTDTSIVNVDN